MRFKNHVFVIDRDKHNTKDRSNDGIKRAIRKF